MAIDSAGMAGKSAAKAAELMTRMVARIRRGFIEFGMNVFADVYLFNLESASEPLTPGVIETGGQT